MGSKRRQIVIILFVSISIDISRTIIAHNHTPCLHPSPTLTKPCHPESLIVAACKIIHQNPSSTSRNHGNTIRTDKNNLHRSQCHARGKYLNPSSRSKEGQTKTECRTPESNKDQSPDQYRNVVESDNAAGWEYRGKENTDVESQLFQDFSSIHVATEFCVFL